MYILHAQFLKNFKIFPGEYSKTRNVLHIKIFKYWIILRFEEEMGQIKRLLDKFEEILETNHFQE